VSFEKRGYQSQLGQLFGFFVIAIGAFGSIVAGVFADRFGRTKITIISLTISGSCALFAGFFFDHPILLSIICLIWGFAVVADSAQFSSAISELSSPKYMGTSLTIQTSLGFLITLVTIRMIPVLQKMIGWEYVFSLLVLGPIFGIWSMIKLRFLPESIKMASGNR